MVAGFGDGPVFPVFLSCGWPTHEESNVENIQPRVWRSSGIDLISDLAYEDDQLWKIGRLVQLDLCGSE